MRYGVYERGTTLAFFYCARFPLIGSESSHKEVEGVYLYEIESDRACVKEVLETIRENIAQEFKYDRDVEAERIFFKAFNLVHQGK